MSLLESLILVSEKAANVARICRQDDHLFSLLVQQKSTSEANPRFVEDFKTLADVLIQEMVKHDIRKQFPDLQKHIYGEENNSFSNKLGETIFVEVKDSVNETAGLLEIVLNGDVEAARLLATEVHREITLDDVNTNISNTDIVGISTDDLAIWIDPIDSTAEYINGVEKVDENGLYSNGLRCATVLIGVFDRVTGTPIMGIINQPFFEQIENRWIGKCYWGMSTPEFKYSSNTPSSKTTNIISLSGSESEELKMKLKDNGFVLAESAGAGYKILRVITGLCDCYVLSQNTTFFWDTCGPQAILKSLGGDIINYGDALAKNFVPINYRMEDTDQQSKIKQFCNYGGIIAYKNAQVLNNLVDVLL